MGGGVSRQRKAPPTAVASSPSTTVPAPSSSDAVKNRAALLNTKTATTDEEEDFKLERTEQRLDRKNNYDGDDYDDGGDNDNELELDEDYESRLFAEDQGGSLSQTAMSFDMDDNDLLFNLLYFNENPEGLDTSNIGSICETAVTETLAAHSEGNTPYKLRPASEKLQAEFDGSEKLTKEIFNRLDVTECSICLDEMLIDCKIAYLKCSHCFHCDCFLRWIKLQGFCPVCKADIETPESSPTSEEKKECVSPLVTTQARIISEEENDRGNGGFVTTKQLNIESRAVDDSTSTSTVPSLLP